MKTLLRMAIAAGGMLALSGCNTTPEETEPEKASVAEWCDALVLNGLDEIVDVDADDFETPDAWDYVDNKDFDYEIQEIQSLKGWERDVEEDGVAYAYYLSSPTRDGFVNDQLRLLDGLVDLCRTAGADIAAGEETELHDEVASLAGRMFDYNETRR